MIIWYCFGTEPRIWITLDLVVQFWWNFVNETFGGSEFSSYEIDLRNRGTQNDVTFRVTSSKSFIETFFSLRVTNSKIKS